MARIVVELTNRCNLQCGHCYDERHADTGELPMSIIEMLLLEGRACGIDHISFTGGEPTLHRRFGEIVQRVAEAGYAFSAVSNGSTFHRVYSLLLAHRAQFKGISFSLDGALEQTHDRLRSVGSYRQVLRAASICVMKALPFSFNMVVTSQNRSEVSEMVTLGLQLGSRGVRFGHLMPTPDTALRQLDLSPKERRDVENEIWTLQKTAQIPIGMAPGYYHTSPFFPCGPLELSEFNIDYRGNLTLCCQLSGYGGATTGRDIAGNLHEMGLAKALSSFRKNVSVYLTEKRARVRSGEFGELDHFPCWYCAKYLDKVPKLQSMTQHPWMR